MVMLELMCLITTDARTLLFGILVFVNYIEVLLQLNFILFDTKHVTKKHKRRSVLYKVRKKMIRFWSSEEEVRIVQRSFLCTVL